MCAERCRDAKLVLQSVLSRDIPTQVFLPLRVECSPFRAGRWSKKTRGNGRRCSTASVFG